MEKQFRKAKNLKVNKEMADEYKISSVDCF